MIVIFLLSCATLIVTAVPVSPNAQPLQHSQNGVSQRGQPVDATIKTAEAQMGSPLPPSLDQPQPGNPQQLDQQANPQQSSHQHTLFPQGGTPMMISFPQSIGGFLPPNQLTLAQQPLVLPSYGFLPVFPSPYNNQLNPETTSNSFTGDGVVQIETCL